MLVSKTKPCKSKYKLYTARLQKAHYISYRVHDGPNCYMDNCSNSRANTCQNPLSFGKEVALLVKKPSCSSGQFFGDS
jgi:hypothetical protein